MLRNSKDFVALKLALKCDLCNLNIAYVISIEPHVWYKLRNIYNMSKFFYIVYWLGAMMDIEVVLLFFSF